MSDLKFKDVKIEFEMRLLELGLSYSVHNDDRYIISNQTGGENHIEVQLISSLPINKQVHGSKNGNVLQAIGLFNFKFLESGLEPDILAFTFQNLVKNRVEFIIIPSQDLFIRQAKMNPGSIRRKSVEMVIWLMEDDCVYETTNISIEAEWYFISKVVRGRMADGTEIDYTKYLNCWRKIIGKVNRA